MDDLISRQSAYDTLTEYYHHTTPTQHDALRDALSRVPSAQPFHNITMNDVLKYIDGMPEDVWQEFTACLECRGWELQRRTTKRFCMNDLIERQAAIDAVNQYNFDFPQYMERFVTELRDAMKADLKNDIEALLSVQPERKKGEWNLCDSCITKGCIFQSGIVRSHCDFYNAKG